MSLAVHNAARDGNVDEVKKLLAQGADLSTRDKLSRTPLHLAAWAGQLECCKALVAEGADKASAAQDDTTALHFASQKGHAEVVRFLLNEGNIELIKLLVKRKANAASTNKSKKTAMDLSKTAEVKAALQEAIDAALQQAEASKAEASGGIATVDSTDQQETAAANEQQRPDLAPEAEPADMIGPQIGPPERPPTHSAATTSNAPAAELHSDVTANQLVSGQPDAGVTASDRQPDTDRPVKKQKVALSFADDDEQ